MTQQHVKPRPAATIILARNSSEGVEVLMMQRTTAVDFATGMHVFPGGAVDPTDHHPEIASLCVDLDDQRASQMLGIEQGGLAYWIAAIRECFEESGLLLGYRNEQDLVRLQGEDAERLATLRLEMAQNKLSFADWNQGVSTPLTWDLSLLSKTGTMMLILGLTNWLTEYGSNQNVVQRYIAARNDGEARKAVWVCVLASLPIWAFYMFLGTALFVFYQQFPSVEAGQMLDGTRKAEEILPWFIVNEMPAGLTGIVIAAALAAAMSSLDSSINAISTVGINDIYRRFLRRQATDAHYLRVAYWISTLSSVLMIGGALAILRADTTTLQDFGTIMVSLFGGGLFGLYAIAFCTDRIRGLLPWIGIGATLLFTGWTIALSNGWLAGPAPFDLYYTTILANAVMVVGILAAWGMKRATNRH